MWEVSERRNRENHRASSGGRLEGALRRLIVDATYSADAIFLPQRPGCVRQPRRAASMVAMSIFFIGIIASKARFAYAPPATSASVSTRGVICQESPQRSVHHPHWLSWPPLPTIAFQ